MIRTIELDSDMAYAFFANIGDNEPIEEMVIGGAIFFGKRPANEAATYIKKSELVTALTEESLVAISYKLTKIFIVGEFSYHKDGYLIFPAEDQHGCGFTVSVAKEEIEEYLSCSLGEQLRIKDKELYETSLQEVAQSLVDFWVDGGFKEEFKIYINN